MVLWRWELALHIRVQPEMTSDEAFGIALTTPPMEARSAAELPADGDWQYEPKWDGFRCLTFRSGADVELRAKSGKSLSRYFPEVVDAVAKASKRSFVIDAEIVIETGGKLSFDALQMRLHPAESRIRKLAAETPAKLIMFDILALDGEELLSRSLSDRRRRLEGLFHGLENHSHRFDLSPCTMDRSCAQDWLIEAGGGQIDGVIVKDRNGPYLPGERAMLKVKAVRTADCVVGGFRYKAGNQLVGSMLLGLYNSDGELDHVGFTSTISNEDRPALTRKLEAISQPPGFTGKAPGGPSRWSTDRSSDWQPVRPDLVVEVRFDHVTGRRFRHGTKLVRWRPDKRPDQCTFEQIAVPMP